MNIIKVTNPTLDDYMKIVRGYSSVYLEDAEAWYTLMPDDITDQDDRDQFSFIRMAMWDKLMEKEYFPCYSVTRSQVFISDLDDTEPGPSPGFYILGGEVWAHMHMQI